MCYDGIMKRGEYKDVILVVLQRSINILFVLLYLNDLRKIFKKKIVDGILNL